jgi:hypothetical protein
MHGWARSGRYKKRTQTSYTELVFLHLVGFMGHVLHFGAFES